MSGRRMADVPPDERGIPFDRWQRMMEAINERDRGQPLEVWVARPRRARIRTAPRERTLFQM
jgi:hypothetical protein